MYIKTLPEDFVVEEVAHHELAEGSYTLCLAEKRNCTTEELLAAVTTTLQLPRRYAAAAGAKDKRAVTRQYITIQCSPDRLATFSHEQISLKVVGTVKEPLHLGDLEGNAFTITVRGLENEDPEPINMLPNYFDTQRFSLVNADVGLAIIKKEFATAVGLVVGTDKKYGPLLEAHLQQHENDYVGALRLIPKQTLLMYVHAYQSRVFNEMLTSYIAEHSHNFLEGPVPIALPDEQIPATTLPLIGFDSETNDYLKNDGITPRDFVNKQLPFLTVEGTDRDAFVPINDLNIGDREPDDLNPDREKQQLSFSLPKGAYATIAIKCLYRNGNVTIGRAV